MKKKRKFTKRLFTIYYGRTDIRYSVNVRNL